MIRYTPSSQLSLENFKHPFHRIRAKRKDSSESWISAILFVMNQTKLMNVAVKYGYFLAHSLWRHFRRITWSVDMKYYMLNPSMKIAAA